MTIRATRPTPNFAVCRVRQRRKVYQVLAGIQLADLETRRGSVDGARPRLEVMSPVQGSRRKLEHAVERVFMRMVERLSVTLCPAFASERQRKIVLEAVLTDNCGLFLQVLSGHSEGLRRYTYISGRENRTGIDRECNNCAEKDDNIHILLKCLRPGRSHRHPSFMDAGDT